MSASAPKGLRGWWMTPPRTGIRRIISPWEYRHLRTWATVRMAAGVILIGLGFSTLGFGGSDSTTYIWASAFLVTGVAEFGVASWLLSVARSIGDRREAL
jgi:hypothetical protein